MFKKRFRLHTSDFMEVFNFGKTVKTPLFIIKIKKNTLPYSRFAVVVSKKISKKAVERNYIKRKYMNALNETSKELPISDYIFILNSGVKDLQYTDILTSLKHINL